MSSLDPPPPHDKIDGSELQSKWLDAYLTAQIARHAAESQAEFETRDAVRATRSESAAARAAARREALTAHRDADIAAQAAAQQLEDSLWSNFLATILNVTTAGIDRARDSAKFVQIAVTAIAAVYTSMLGLVFSTSDDPLPVRATFPALFLGVSIALVVAYLAFVGGGIAAEAPPPMSSLTDTQLARTAWYTQWVESLVASRRWALRAAVLAFGVAIALLPAPFISPSVQKEAASEAPAVPERIPAGIQEVASEVYRVQAEAYLAAVKAEPGAASRLGECGADGRSYFWMKCSWRTDGGLNWAFLQLTALGLLLVVLVPTAMQMLEWSHNNRGSPSDDQIAPIDSADDDFETTARSDAT